MALNLIKWQNDCQSEIEGHHGGSPIVMYYNIGLESTVNISSKAGSGFSGCSQILIRQDSFDSKL